MIGLKRIYEKAQPSDGYRVLVDRLWPRGISKEKAGFDLWLKEIAPSNELRKWFGHDPLKWEEFQKQYYSELKAKSELVEELNNTIKEKGSVTLLYSAFDEQHNNAVVLKNFLTLLNEPV